MAGLAATVSYIENITHAPSPISPPHALPNEGITANTLRRERAIYDRGEAEGEQRAKLRPFLQQVLREVSTAFCITL